MSEIAKPSPFLRESSIADLALTDRWAGAEFTAAREAAWYRHHTHLVIEMWEGTVGGRGGSRNRAPGWPCHGSGSRLRDLFSRGRCADKFEILDCHQTAINSPKSKQICRQTDSPARSGHPIDFVRQSEGTFSCVGHNFDYESAALPNSVRRRAARPKLGCSHEPTGKFVIKNSPSDSGVLCSMRLKLRIDIVRSSTRRGTLDNS